MKNYDNYFLPVDNMEEAKRYYEEILGLKKKFDFSDKGMVAYNIGNEEPAIILKDKNKFENLKPTIWFEVEDEKTIKKYGGTKMFFAPPIYYDELMKKVPKGKLITVSVMRDYLAKTNNADFTDPMTAGIFVNIVAWASYQRDEDITPYWRTLKSDGELNVKYPEGKELQKRLLEEEGHTIISKGTKNIKYYVKDFENSLIEL